MNKRYVNASYEITDSYSRILIDAEEGAVRVEPSPDNFTKFVVCQKKNRPYEYFVQDDTLTIKPAKRKWFNFFSIGIDHSKINLFVPEKIYESISVDTNVGHVDISSINCDNLTVQRNTGKLKVDNVCCIQFEAKGNTGATVLNNLVAKEKIKIKNNTGKVLLNDCSAPDIFAKTNTGNVCGKLPAGTMFKTNTTTGRIETPKATIGEVIIGICEIKTNTGNIKFE